MTVHVIIFAMKQPVAILGAGNIGTAIAVVLAQRGNPIRMYCIEEDVEREINTKSCNTKYLHGLKLPSSIRACHDIAETLRKAEVVVVAVPSSALTEVMTAVAPHLGRNAVIAVMTKSMDSAAAYLPKNIRRNVCVIAGPAIAHELARGYPAGLHLAGANKQALGKLARLLANETLKVETSNDLKGASYAMALKNVYAIALGMCDGLKYPMNTKALILTLALQELRGILGRLGTKPETAMSLAGLGDLLVTGFSPYGRNRTFGERLVGATSKEPEDLGLLTVEGIAATRSALALVKKLKIKAPLIETVAACLKAKKAFAQPFVSYLKKLKLK